MRGRTNGALEELEPSEPRHGTVRMAIALRPLTRAYPADHDLATALTTTLAVRDQAVAEAAAHHVRR